MSRLMAWCVLAATWSVALPARAAPETRPLTEALQVQRGAACLQRETLVAQVAAWLGKDTIDGDLSVHVRASAADARDVSFELRRGGELLTSRRFFPAPAACAPLEAILALAIAMALEVSLRDALLASLAAQERGLQSSLAAFAELGIGLVSSMSAGAALRAGLRVHRAAALHFDGLFHTAQDQPLGGGSGDARVDIWLVGVRVAACLLMPITSRLMARLCAGVGAGSLRIAGQGSSEARTARLPWADATAGAELSVALSARWSLDAGANVELPLGTRSYGVRYADGTIAASHQLPSVAATLRAGPAYHF